MVYLPIFGWFVWFSFNSPMDPMGIMCLFLWEKMSNSRSLQNIPPIHEDLFDTTPLLWQHPTPTLFSEEAMPFSILSRSGMPAEIFKQRQVENWISFFFFFFFRGTSCWMAMMFVDFSVKDTFTFVSSWCAMFWGDGSMNNLEPHLRTGNTLWGAFRCFFGQGKSLNIYNFRTFWWNSNRFIGRWFCRPWLMTFSEDAFFYFSWRFLFCRRRWTSLSQRNWPPLHEGVPHLFGRVIMVSVPLIPTSLISRLSVWKNSRVKNWGSTIIYIPQFSLSGCFFPWGFLLLQACNTTHCWWAPSGDDLNLLDQRNCTTRGKLERPCEPWGIWFSVGSALSPQWKQA